MPSLDILTTKLFVPLIRPELVRRPRLIERLNDTLTRDLTLVSAPAGFGKTTLVSAWVGELRANGQSVSGSGNCIGWLSLDEADGDTERFLAYLIAALAHSGGLETGVAEEATAMLHSPQPPPTEALLTFLINNLAGTPGPIVLVLDDYHLVDSSPAVDSLAFLLDHLPPQVHLIVATRVDPQLPLSRLRATGRMSEIRAAELRFTPAEATEFLNRVMGLHLSEEDVLALEKRTEGWIAGLQLAALSLKGRQDTGELIHAFTGSHRLVLDYLIEEVLSRQPDEVETFLFKTAVLDQMNGPLCDAVTGQGNGQATLEMLDRENMFVVPLDQERRWYRYHRLFGDLLRQRLQGTRPDQPPILHLKASEWYEDNGFTERAIRHAAKAADFDRAAQLAEQAWRTMHTSYGGVTWLRWVESIPDEVVRARPVLSTGYAWSLIDSGDLEHADLRLKDAERWLDSHSGERQPSGNAAINQAAMGETDNRSLAGSIANARAYLAEALGDVDGTLFYAQKARDLLPEEDRFEQGLSAILPGFAYWSSGELDAACQSISEAIACMRTEGRLAFVISFSSYLADVMIAQGRLNEAKETYLQLLDYSESTGDPGLPEMSVVHFGLSEIHHEQGDLEAARRHLQLGESMGELPAFPPWYRHWVHAQVRVMGSLADWQGIRGVLKEAGRLYNRHPIPDVRPLSALGARQNVIEGRLDEALSWVHEQGLTVEEELAYLREYEHLTLARILAAQCRIEHHDELLRRVAGLLGRLLEAAEQGHRWGSVIEILVLQALVHDLRGDRARALVELGRALRLAAPEGYVHTFTGEGAPLATLLNELQLDDPGRTAFLRRLLDGQQENGSQPAVEQPLVEPLSERELEVLEQLASGHTNQVIAERLFLSINTIKAHTRNIYGKLGVNNRTQAVARARQLRLLES